MRASYLDILPDLGCISTSDACGKYAYAARVRFLGRHANSPKYTRVACMVHVPVNKAGLPEKHPRGRSEVAVVSCTEPLQLTQQRLRISD